MKSRLLDIVLLTLLLYLAFPRQAHAYLDPGTGSYVFQLLVAGLIGSSFFLKSAIKKIKEKLTRHHKEEREDNRQ